MAMISLCLWNVDLNGEQWLSSKEFVGGACKTVAES